MYAKLDDLKVMVMRYKPIVDTLFQNRISSDQKQNDRWNIYFQENKSFGDGSATLF